jgi:hypothetical protein
LSPRRPVSALFGALGPGELVDKRVVLRQLVVEIQGEDRSSWGLLAESDEENRQQR